MTLAVEAALLARLTPDGRKTWMALDAETRQHLVAWAGKPRTRRGRRTRDYELHRQVELGFPAVAVGSPPAIESLIEGVIFGGR